MIQGYFDSPQITDRLGYISKSKIALANEGLEYFFMEYGEGMRRPQTRIQAECSRFHEMVLEPEKFHRKRIVHRFSDMNNATAKEWKKQKLREYPEAVIISLEESLRYERLLDRIMSHPLAGSIISRSSNEKHGYAKDPETGAMLYSRPDIKTPEGYICELKFVDSADPFQFARRQFEHKWFMQLAFYNAVDALICNEKKQENCLYIAVEYDYPHRLSVITLEGVFEAMGEILWKEGVNKILRCLEKDPRMKNFEVWREESYKAIPITPEYFMLSKDPRFTHLMNL